MEENYYENKEGRIMIDIYETENEFVILAPIAGVSAKDLEITIKKDVLTIKGYRKIPAEVTKRVYLHRECFWGHFNRSIFLPHHLDPAKIKARFINGLLIIRIPKIKEEQITLKPEEIQ